MTVGDIYAELNRIFQDVFLRDDLVVTSSLAAADLPDWDSFKQIEIILAVEEHFHIKLHTREIDRLQNVGDLAQTILLKTAGRPYAKPLTVA